MNIITRMTFLYRMLLLLGVMFYGCATIQEQTRIDYEELPDQSFDRVRTGDKVDLNVNYLPEGFLLKAEVNAVCESGFMKAEKVITIKVRESRNIELPYILGSALVAIGGTLLYLHYGAVEGQKSENKGFTWGFLSSGFGMIELINAISTTIRTGEEVIDEGTINRGNFSVTSSRECGKKPFPFNNVALETDGYATITTKIADVGSSFSGTLRIKQGASKDISTHILRHYDATSAKLIVRGEKASDAVFREEKKVELEAEINVDIGKLVDLLSPSDREEYERLKADDKARMQLKQERLDEIRKILDEYESGRCEALKMRILNLEKTIEQAAKSPSVDNIAVISKAEREQDVKRKELKGIHDKIVKIAKDPLAQEFQQEIKDALFQCTE